ncbi:MAG TPA: aldo/keto reductase [Xanthobacteraceae bacterium]|jgi:L-galactose dehydrogenase/L-glyceraldehyde 3-phosphate reductase
MRKSILGRTGLEVSEIALGGGVTGGILINASEPTRFTALQRAVAGGINWIDTAPLYGNGASEETIGRHISALSPRPHVSTKVRLERGDMADIAGAIRRSLEQSLKRLQLDRLALLQLHNQIGTAVGDRPPLSARLVLGAVADTFDRLKEEGLVQASGISAVGDTSACLEVIESGRFDVAQVYYNAINPSAAWSRTSDEWRGQEFCGIMAACWRLHMGMLAIRVMAGGPLASPRRPERLAVMTADTDLDNEMRCAAAVQAALGTSYGTPAQAVLRFTLGNRDLSSRVIGITEVAQLDEALAAVERGPLPPEAIAKLDQLWATDFFMNG